MNVDDPELLEEAYAPLPSELPTVAVAALNRLRMIDGDLKDLRQRQRVLQVWRQVAMCVAVDQHPEGAAGVAREMGMLTPRVTVLAEAGRPYSFLRRSEIHAANEGDFIYTLFFDQVEGQPERKPISGLPGHLMLDMVYFLVGALPGGCRGVLEADGKTLRFEE